MKLFVLFMYKLQPYNTEVLYVLDCNDFAEIQISVKSLTSSLFRLVCLLALAG